jgi:hypothetical protein
MSRWSPEQLAQRAKASAKWRVLHPEECRISRKKQDAKRCPEDALWHYMRVSLWRYKMTLDQYHALQEQQDFCCAICHEEKSLTIDHNHETNMVRGLLCNGCNTGVGLFKESAPLLHNAESYLAHYANQ